MWTQSEAFAHGIADSECCLLCGNGVTPGTALHRLGFCTGHEEERLHAPRRWQHQLQTLQAGSELLWTRGLAADPAARYQFQPQEEAWECIFNPVDSHDSPLFEILMRAVERHLGDSGVQALASTVWAFTAASQRDAWLFAALVQAA